MDSTVKDCNTCKDHIQGNHPPVSCRECLIASEYKNVYLPFWKPKEMSKVYDATFRDDNPVKEITTRSDGSTADYYVLPKGSTQLQDLISFKNMNAQVGEIFRACYRYGQVEHSEKLRDAKKMLFYAKAEVERLEKYA